MYNPVVEFEKNFTTGYNIVMDGFLQMKIFFLISSFGFVVLFVLLAVLIAYLIRISSTSARILDRAEKDIGDLSDNTREMLEDLRDNIIFRFLFGKKKKRRKN